MILIRDLLNIVNDYADIKDCCNRCNICNKYKNEKMRVLDIVFYEIKLSFILDRVFNKGMSRDYSNFEKIVSSSKIMSNDYSSYGWVTNSLDIEEYWYKEKNQNNYSLNRLEYYEFLNDNFILLEERCVTVCDSCKTDNRKIKLD